MIEIYVFVYECVQFEYTFVFVNIDVTKSFHWGDHI